MILSTQFSGIKLSLLQNEILNSGKTNACRYSCIIPPRAYKYAKKIIRLPSISTLRRWNTIKGDPSWTCESFEILKEMAKSPNTKMDCTLIIDDIHIKGSS